MLITMEIISVITMEIITEIMLEIIMPMIGVAMLATTKVIIMVTILGTT